MVISFSCGSIDAGNKNKYDGEPCLKSFLVILSHPEVSG